mgnify:CR=1 FL=1
MLVLITVTQLTAAIASHYYYYNYRSEMMAITAGASGWLFGLIGYGIAHFHRQTGVLKDYQHQLIKWGIYSLIFGYIIGANNAAQNMVSFAPFGPGPEPIPAGSPATLALLAALLALFGGRQVAVRRRD